jgi:hypothetical protein
LYETASSHELISLETSFSFVLELFTSSLQEPWCLSKFALFALFSIRATFLSCCKPHRPNVSSQSPFSSQLPSNFLILSRPDILSVSSPSLLPYLPTPQSHHNCQLTSTMSNYFKDEQGTRGQSPTSRIKTIPKRKKPDPIQDNFMGRCQHLSIRVTQARDLSQTQREA